MFLRFIGDDLAMSSVSFSIVISSCDTWHHIVLEFDRSIDEDEESVGFKLPDASDTPNDKLLDEPIDLETVFRCESEPLSEIEKLPDVAVELLRSRDSECVAVALVVAVGDLLREKLGVTHIAKCFHARTGLHLPLWFVHQWHTGDVTHISCRWISVVHVVAHVGFANASDDATQ